MPAHLDSSRHPRVHTSPISPFHDKPWVFGEEWGIGIVPVSIADLFQQPSLLRKTEWLEIPWPNGYGCDPWLVEDGSARRVFFEFYDKRLKRGVICCGTLESWAHHWRITDVRKVIQEPHHLSHPCVFFHQDRWFLLPEAADTGNVVLYESLEFPYHWQRCEVIIKGVPGLDPTFFEYDGRCWIFCNLKSGSHNADLHLFHAPDPIGPWAPHPANPIKSDLCGSRPAGPIFSHRGKWIRPGQDSLYTYGQNVVLNEIKRLNEVEYEEQPLISLKSPVRTPFVHGLHTFGIADDFCLIDAKRFTGLKAVWGPCKLALRRVASQLGWSP